MPDNKIRTLPPQARSTGRRYAQVPNSDRYYEIVDTKIGSEVVADGKKVKPALPQLARGRDVKPGDLAATLGKLVSRKRVAGGSGSANASALTGVQVLQAPVPAFDSVRLILHIKQATLPGSNVKLTIAASAKPGRNPVLANDAAAPWTTVTFGGAASVAVANASASADGGAVESDYVSDLMPLASIPRADGGVLALAHARITASSYVPLFSHGGYDPSLVEPNYISGTVSGDQTTAVLASDPINTYFHIPITWVFYHQGTRVFSITTGGDSTMQGSTTSAATANDNSLGLFNGFPRTMKDAFVAAGIPMSVEQACVHGQTSLDFHERVRSALNNLNGEGLTHVFLYPVSVNDPSPNPTTFLAAQARVRSIIDLAVSKGVTPVLIRNPPGYETPVGVANGYNEFLDAIAAEGKALVFDMRTVPGLGLTASGYPAMPAVGRLHATSDGSLLSDNHPNNYFHNQAGLALYADRVRLKFANA